MACCHGLRVGRQSNARGWEIVCGAVRQRAWTVFGAKTLDLRSALAKSGPTSALNVVVRGACTAAPPPPAAACACLRSGRPCCSLAGCSRACCSCDAFGQLRQRTGTCTRGTAVARIQLFLVVVNYDTDRQLSAAVTELVSVQTVPTGRAHAVVHQRMPARCAQCMRMHVHAHASAHIPRGMPWPRQAWPDPHETTRLLESYV